jgi:hypothetical protein
VTDAGEMYFAKFNLNKRLVTLVQNKKLGEIEKIREINKIYGGKILPSYVLQFIQINKYPSHIAIHDIRRVRPGSAYHDTLYRPKRVLGGQDIDKFPNAVHHFMVITNTLNEARIVYKYAGNVKFLKNLKKR